LNPDMNGFEHHGDFARFVDVPPAHHHFAVVSSVANGHTFMEWAEQSCGTGWCLADRQTWTGLMDGEGNLLP